MSNKKKERNTCFVHSFLVLLRSPYSLLLISTLILIMVIVCFVTHLHICAKLDRQIADEAGKHILRLAEMEQSLVSRIQEAEQNTVAAIGNASGETRNAIRALDMTYRELLSAQQRRTLEALYREDTLVTERREAAAAFAAGRYVTANRLYSDIAQAHGDDLEVKFYQYYSLFLINRMDRNQYFSIRSALVFLESQGYHRREITETLAFIAEETGINEEVKP